MTDRPAFILAFPNGSAELHERLPSRGAEAYRSRVVATGTEAAMVALGMVLGFGEIEPERGLAFTGTL